MKAMPTWRQRPCSTQDTGIGSSESGGDEHADVEDPVLLRSDELLAVVEQNGLRERIHDAELGDGTARANLLDAETAWDRLLEREVAGAWIGEREQRTDHDPSVLDGIADLERVLDHATPFVSKESCARAVRLTYVRR